MDNYSLSDIAAVSNGGGLFGGTGNGIIDLAALALFANGGFGFGGNRNQAATTDELSAGFNFAGVNGKLNEIVAGQANTNQNLGNAVCSSTYELGSKIDSCCCNTQLGIKDLMATVVAEGSATRTLMLEQENANLRQNDLKNYVDKATCGIPRVSTTGWGVYPLSCGNGCNTAY